MGKVFGIDLGTASIGYSLRDTENGELITYGAWIFPQGVGNSKTGEFSYAAERTKHHSTRRLYQARKYRIWGTLETLIEFGFCPLSIDDLDRWRKYDKAKGFKRQYPVDAVEFEQWIKLDFNGDGKPDYANPYELRAELATAENMDFTQEINRFKLGRALYHIAQRRGFKSNKGETLKEQEKEAQDNVANEIDFDSVSLKKSEEKKSKDLSDYMAKNGLSTIGCAFAQLLKEGKRVRASAYQAVRSQYRDEIKYIFTFQGLDKTHGELYKRIYSDKKGGCIFYMRPLRSQKGLVGKCTLEPAKSRCPISHPEFEKFRAFSFINNIQYRTSTDGEWQTLSPAQKLKLYNEKFLQTKSNFKFEVIREWMEKEIETLQGRHLSKRNQTINYDDRTNVSACPVSGRLKSIFGARWEEYKYDTEKERINKKGEKHRISYTIEDIWHVCFSYEDEDCVSQFAQSLNLDDDKVKKFKRLWMAVPQGYAMLSLKAIRNINRFLVPQQDNPLYKGYIYSEAVFLGKLPEILGYKWGDNEKTVLTSIARWMDETREKRRILNIANNLIAAYKALEYNEELGYDERFAYKDTEYKLEDTDKKNVENYTIEAFGQVSWNKKPQDIKEKILKEVEDLYQRFFSSVERDYYRLPKLGDTIKRNLSQEFQDKKWDKLYHPSMIEPYQPSIENGLKVLGKPVTGSFKNPMAMRALYQLRQLVNHFIKQGVLDEETRVVVEIARDLNDANMRWAINEYNREREKENQAIVDAIKELRGETIGDYARDKARLLIEQHRDYLFDDEDKNEENIAQKNTKGKKEKIDFSYKKDVTKYRLWLEQGMQCLYTGRIINLSDLFAENATDIEHTIPRSRSFDDSMANKTVCDADYNRNSKKNRMPTELPDYEKIKSNLLPWEKKVERLRQNVDFWKLKSKQAQTKDAKDKAIRQKHLWQMELDYWNDKLSRFTMTEVPDGFKHSQLNDTRLITKYAYHYLKSVFNKVDVQKGVVTAEFRKILGIQDAYEEKDRDKHSHHAIDATVLTMIPVAAKRDEMLKLFYEIQELRDVDTSVQEKRLKEKITSCKIGNMSALVKQIEENILIRHISKDQTLTPAIRNKRVRGKVIWKRDENGKICVDANGKKIPKYKVTGDCIRGKLHGDSFYGAIMQSKKKDGDNYTTSYQDISYVIRRELKYKASSQDTGFKNLDDLHKVIVDEHLFSIIQQQCERKAFKDACSEGIYMLNKNGDKVNRIRHIRCYAPKIKNPLHIKQQTYLSPKDYKQSYHVEVGDLYVMCRYCNTNRTKVEYEVIKLFDVSGNRKDGYDIPDIWEKDKTKEKYYLDAVLHRGKQMVLYKDQNDLANVLEMNNEELSQRLYVIKRFESDNRIILHKHICSKSEQDLGDGETISSFDSLPEKIRQSINRLNYLLEDVDFTITLDGKIDFEPYITRMC